MTVGGLLKIDVRQFERSEQIGKPFSYILPDSDTLYQAILSRSILNFTCFKRCSSMRKIASPSIDKYVRLCSSRDRTVTDGQYQSTIGSCLSYTHNDK